MRGFLFVCLVLITAVVACGGGAGELTVSQAMQAFRDAGLECEEAQPIDPNDGTPVPKTFIEAQRCVVPSVGADHGLRVFAFDSTADMEQVQAYYQAFTGALGSYVYTRDNLLFQTSVSMPKETADMYQEVFMSFGE